MRKDFVLRRSLILGRKGSTSANNSRLLSKSTYTTIFKKVYPEVIKKLDDNNELPTMSMKRQRKSVPRKRTAHFVDVNENSRTPKKLLNKSNKLSRTESNVKDIENSNTVNFSSTASSVVRSIKTIQIVHLI